MSQFKKFLPHFLLLISIKLASSSIQNPPFCHPLDPLTPREIQETVQIVTRSLPAVQHKGHGTWAFYWINLKEPPKARLLPFFLFDLNPPCQSQYIPRRAFVQLVEKQRNIVSEVIVNLFSGTIESWNQQPSGTQPTYTVEENIDGEAIAKSDPRVQERCRQMGWTNMSLVLGEVWTVAYAEDRPEIKRALRPVILYMYGTMFEGDNHFAHPFDFAVVVDLAPRKVIAIDNLPTHSGFDPNNRVGNVCPKVSANYDPQFKPPNFLRTDVHPIRFSQPQGASFKIRGNEIIWQKFKIRIGFNAREGLVIHQVSYQDGRQRRPLFYRMSVAEVFVPYGDPRPPFHQKFPFDEGEFSLGLMPIDHKEAGICRGGVVAYVDAVLHDEQGTVRPFPNALCIYEEDAGLLWGHLGRDGRVLHARSQRLSITCFSNLGNYDYKISWRFYQNAVIEMETELHGIISSQLQALNETSTGGKGSLVFPQINGQYHQHNIALRLDTEIDGNMNTVSTVDIVPLTAPTGSPGNPYGQGWTTKEKVLRTPVEARTLISPFTGRNWLIRNPTKMHPYTKQPVAWKLVPYNAPLPFVRKDSPLHPRGAFTDYNVWVTKYKDDQLYPAGFYLNATGLPEWVAENPNEDITGTDVVLWYIFGYAHVPKAEDFPLMSTESYGIFLKPTNFFTENPGLDVPGPVL